ncbi:P-loop NTPase fold protein [Lysinibacillus xylanilyticus]|uniref:P-loop NTPase fold protein n=1 Tax=Lysinibacillus xylanilyticus TaxID=582475 RepID=UPI003CFFFE9E
MKSNISKFIIYGCLAYFIFNSIKPTPKSYVIVFTILGLLMAINFSFYKNIDLFKSLAIINLGIFAGYLFSILNNGAIFKDRIDTIYLFWVGLWLVVIFFLLLMNKFSKSNQVEASPRVLKKRNKDLDLLVYYVDMFPSIGLNSKWGTGKTFLINLLKEKLRYKYEIIEIDLLNCNLKEMQSILISRLEDVLYENEILPKHSNKLKRNIQSASVLSKFKDLTNLAFTGSDNKSEAFLEFKKELEKINKKILVIYEDIDRITDKNVIIDIFGISEKLANENVKIIYQYDEDVIKNLGFEDAYLEKYIPFKMNLTELHFKELVQFELQNVESSILSIKDFEFVMHQQYRFDILTKFFGFKNEDPYTLKFEYFPIRKIKNMIAELLSVINAKKDLFEKDEKLKEVIIAFYLLKHLYPKSYKLINSKDGLLETLTFIHHIEGNEIKKINIMQLISEYNTKKINKDSIKKILDNEENIFSYGILKLFNYEIVKREEYQDDSIYFERLSKSSHNNEKRDRIIRHLMYQGTSALTDSEYAKKKFIEEVLLRPLSEQREAYNKFNKDLFNMDYIIDDQTTPNKIGKSSLLTLFEIFKVVNADNEMQLKLIDFYFNCNEISEFNRDVLKCLNNCTINTKEEYFKILRYIVELKVICNFEDYKEFLDFLKKYMQALTRMKIYNAWEYFDDYSKFHKLNDQIFILTKIRDDLKSIRLHHQSLGVLNTHEDITIVINFLEKLLEIINCKKSLNSFEQQDFINVNMEVSRERLEKFDYYKKLLDSEIDYGQIYQEIDDSYANGELSLYEISMLVADKEPASNNQRFTKKEIEQKEITDKPLFPLITVFIIASNVLTWFKNK